MKIVAVDGREFSPQILQQAILDAKGSQTPLELITVNTGFYKILHIDYHAGPRYPVFERVANTPDRLDEILKPLTN